MNKKLISKIKKYVVDHIEEFHDARLKGLDNLKLKKVLKDKNPYLYKAKNQGSACAIVKGILDSHLSSSEESMFGDWLEGLAIFVAGEVYGGKKSSAPGIDLEFDKEGIRYIVSIKSGPHWGNKSQFDKMKADFKSSIRTLHTSKSKLHVQAVNGCCYGKDGSPDKGEYLKLCGQDFWEFISGEERLYLEIIEPLAENAKERNETFNKKYDCKLDGFVVEFLKEFASADGSVDWQKLVAFNSGRKVCAAKCCKGK